MATSFTYSSTNQQNEVSKKLTFEIRLTFVQSRFHAYCLGVLNKNQIMHLFLKTQEQTKTTIASLISYSLTHSLINSS